MKEGGSDVISVPSIDLYRWKKILSSVMNNELVFIQKREGGPLMSQI